MGPLVAMVALIYFVCVCVSVCVRCYDNGRLSPDMDWIYL